jgi:hypothetical protein
MALVDWSIQASSRSEQSDAHAWAGGRASTEATARTTQFSLATGQLGQGMYQGKVGEKGEAIVKMWDDQVGQDRWAGWVGPVTDVDVKSGWAALLHASRQSKCAPRVITSAIIALLLLRAVCLQVDSNPELGTTEDWVWINYSPDAHPMHIHARAFMVRASSLQNGP